MEMTEVHWKTISFIAGNGDRRPFTSHITSLQVLSHWMVFIRESGRSLSGIEMSLVD